MRAFNTKPLRGRRARPQQHLILHVGYAPDARKMTPTSYRAWRVHARDEVWDPTVVPWDGPTDLGRLLTAESSRRRELIVWLWAGWPSAIHTGLTAMMDRGDVAFRRLAIGGQKFLLRGSLMGNLLTVTSMANWTLGAPATWDRYRTDPVYSLAVGLAASCLPEGAPPLDATEQTALGTHAVICGTSFGLGLRRIEPTATGAAARLWLRFLGPRLIGPAAAAPGKGSAPEARKGLEIVAPLRQRPRHVAALERHVCYALPHRQFGRGHIPDGFDVVDMSAAYLRGLSCQPLPGAFAESIRAPSVDILRDRLLSHVCTALVEIRGNALPLPCAGRKGVRLCHGHFWTWLCGLELLHAATAGCVRSCVRLHTWHPVRHTPRQVERLLAIAPALKSSRMLASAALWRSLYSVLVGGFASWPVRWEDADHTTPLRNWWAWVEATGNARQLESWRAVAGRCQRLEADPDNDRSVPLLYGVVTSWVRAGVWAMAAMARPDTIYGVASDALWVRRGYGPAVASALGELMGGADCCHVGASYDEAWLSGAASAVVRSGDRLLLRAPGLLGPAQLDRDGRASMDVAAGWTETGLVPPDAPVPVHRRVWPGAQIVERYAAPFAPGRIALELRQPLLSQRLLRPVPPPHHVRPRA